MTAIATSAAGEAQDTVVLIHGLGRTKLSLLRLASRLEREGYRVFNLSYPSRTASLETLAHQWLPDELASIARGSSAATARQSALAPQAGKPVLHESATPRTTGRLHFVTHSMGGIILRLWLRDHPAPANLGRIVMLAPPNAGSEVSDKLHAFPPFRWLTGASGRRLGTGSESLPARLGPWPDDHGELGVIAGDRSLNPLFSAWLPGADDGKVSVAATHLAGERAHCVLHHSHTWLAWRTDTVDNVSSFLQTGSFLAPKSDSTRQKRLATALTP